MNARKLWDFIYQCQKEQFESGNVGNFDIEFNLNVSCSKENCSNTKCIQTCSFYNSNEFICKECFVNNIINYDYIIDLSTLYNKWIYDPLTFFEKYGDDNEPKK